jgi:hypothetical protein
LEAGIGGGLSTVGDRVSSVGAWIPSLDGDLGPSTRVEQVGLVCARGTSEACVFLGT